MHAIQKCNVTFLRNHSVNKQVFLQSTFIKAAVVTTYILSQHIYVIIIKTVNILNLEIALPIFNADNSHGQTITVVQYLVILTLKYAKLKWGYRQIRENLEGRQINCFVAISFNDVRVISTHFLGIFWAFCMMLSFYSSFYVQLYDSFEDKSCIK